MLKTAATANVQEPHGECFEVFALTRGSFHEIKVLRFTDGWSCIARLTRCKEHIAKATSEIATMEYVRARTTIPVPEVYYSDLEPQNPVGAPYVLMERLPGKHLYYIWDKLSTEHKKCVVSQLAGVIFQLSRLKFGTICSLRDKHGASGPVQNLSWSKDSPGRGPFTSLQEFFECILTDREPRELDMANQEVQGILHGIQKELKTHFESSTLAIKPPYTLIHGEFDGQNMLFAQPDDKSQPPKLTGIIDWDCSYTGPIYFLYEYPVFVIDVDSMYTRHEYSDNKVLRKHLVQCLRDKFPTGSPERTEVLECFKEKAYWLNNFHSIMMRGPRIDVDRPDAAKRLFERYLRTLRDGDGKAYSGRDDWEPDTEPDTEGE